MQNPKNPNKPTKQPPNNKKPKHQKQNKTKPEKTQRKQADHPCLISIKNLINIQKGFKIIH